MAATYDIFIFDCDGVLWHGKDKITGSFEAVKYLLDSGKKVYLLTNASFRPRTSILDKFEGLSGIKIPIETIYSSAYLTCEYLKATAAELGEDNPLW